MSAMLSPTSLAGLSISPADWARPVRAVSASPAPSLGTSQLSAPLSLMPQGSTGGGQQDGGTPRRNLPRGSVLDLSV
jgi:hypothetical protein